MQLPMSIMKLYPTTAVLMLILPSALVAARGIKKAQTSTTGGYIQGRLERPTIFPPYLFQKYSDSSTSATELEELYH